MFEKKRILYYNESGLYTRKGNTMKKKFLRVFLPFLLLFFFLFSNFNLETKVLADSITQTNGTNFEYTFTSIEGETISTLANPGQITVLIFGHINCSNSKNTVRNIANSKWVNNPDIRVIFAECNRASLEQTKAFAQTYGCDSITFCFDDTRIYNSIYYAMWDYYDLFYASGGDGTLPFTVLIDGNNQIQNVLTGNRTADAIWKEINKFASTGPEETNTNIHLEISGTENYTYVNDVLDLVNQTRAAKGLPALVLDSGLLESAMQRAAENSLYYSHTRPDGSECFTIFNRGTRRSENIAVGYNSPQAVMNAWNTSPGHYQNIIDPYVRSIGIGCFKDNKGNLYWVQLFDNDPAVTPSVSENKQVNRIISIQKDLLHLQADTNRTFYDTEINQMVEMEIYHKNETSNSTTQKLLSSNFNFKSSNHSVATISDNGMITLKGLGSAVITASLKENDSIFLEQTITINKKPASNNTTISKVSDLKANSKTNSVKLTWKKVSNAKGYLVYQYDSTKKKWNKIASVPSNTTLYTVKKLSSGSTYRFAVKAYLMQDKQQVTSPSYTSLYTATKPASVILNVSAGKQKAILKWNKVKGSTGYRIYYKTNAADAWNKLGDIKDTDYIKTKLKSGKNYFFMVKAYKTYKGKTYISSGSTKKVTIK